MAKEDTTIGGYLFPKGTLVSLDIYGLHHHEVCRQGRHW